MIPTAFDERHDHVLLRLPITVARWGLYDYDRPTPCWEFNGNTLVEYVLVEPNALVR